MVPSRLYKHLRPLAHTHFPIPTKWIHQWGIYPKPGRVLFSPSSDPANMGGGDRRREKKSWHLPANTSLKNTRCMLRYPTKNIPQKITKTCSEKSWLVMMAGGEEEREREREKLLRNQYKTLISLFFFFFFLLTIPLPFPVAASYSYSNFRTSSSSRFPNFFSSPSIFAAEEEKEEEKLRPLHGRCKYGKRIIFQFFAFQFSPFPSTSPQKIRTFCRVVFLKKTFCVVENLRRCNSGPLIISAGKKSLHFVSCMTEATSTHLLLPRKNKRIKRHIFSGLSSPSFTVPCLQL